jgi:putative ABC transport system permease protein
MDLSEKFRLAFRQIWAQKLKSFFSILGVVLGVMFLLVVVSIVEGMDRYVREDFGSAIFGVNTITLRRLSSDPAFRGSGARARDRRPRVTTEDWEALEERITIPGRVGAENQLNNGGEVVSEDGRKAENVQIFAVSEEVPEIRSWVVTEGRSFTPQEQARGASVIILGTETADLLFENLNSIGRRVRVRGASYRVIGVLEEQGSLFGISLDNLVVAPLTSPMQSFQNGRNILDRVVIQAEDPGDLRALQSEVEGILRTQRRLRPTEENNFNLQTADQTLSFWDNISKILFLALPGLVATSLVVGGIVIMNIMLVSVMERTREIGIRKAIGARRNDILSQILIETITLTGTGAIIGVILGTSITFLINANSALPAAIDWKWILLSVLLGTLVGVGSGIYPASQAAKLPPVDALRYE